MKPRRCLRCRGPVSAYQRVCAPCSRNTYIRSRFLSGGALAQQAVALARSQGRLVSPRTLPCVDCGVSATEYDHRDYNKPLEVQPVCRGCNVRRGKAIPKQWAPGEWRAYAQRRLASRNTRSPAWYAEALLSISTEAA